MGLATSQAKQQKKKQEKKTTENRREAAKKTNLAELVARMPVARHTPTVPINEDNEDN